MPKPLRDKKKLSTRKAVPVQPSKTPSKPTRSDRKHEDRKPDQRNPFQRDRDRVLYCSAFRRLAGVTQVVHTAEGHIFHNRLTHTLKAAQVARRIAEYLLHSTPDLRNWIDPDVVETAALVHDLGHPPFGHIAEQELDDQLLEQKVTDGYEGNAQSFRIVTKVAIRYPGHLPGLNLTRATLNAILKYPWSRGTSGKESKKWGYYYSEKEEFEFARALVPTDPKQSLETTIMDWADDITYSVHDVDDFYRAGLIPLERLLRKTAERERFFDAVYKRWEEEGHKERIRTLSRSAANNMFDELGFLAKLDSAFSCTRAQQALLDFISAFLIRRYILGADGNDAIQITQTSPPAVKIHQGLRAEVDLLKALMQYYVFHNPALVTQQFGQRRVIRELFEIYYAAAKPGSKEKALVPYPFREALETITDTDDQARARLVADLITSMTEQQALLLHKRLTGIEPGSVRDPIIR